MQAVALSTIAESLVDRLVATLVEWFTPRDQPEEATRIERALRSLSEPIVRANDDDEFDRAFSVAVERIPELMCSLPRLPAGEVVAQSEVAARKVPWLLQRVAGDVEPAALVGEFTALLQLHVHVFGRLLAKVSSPDLERAAAMKDEDLRALARDPSTSRTFESLVVLFALAGVHDALGRSDTWRRARLVERGLAAIRASGARLPEERSLAWVRWYVHVAFELGLWHRSFGDVSGRVADALEGTPSSALAALRDRCRADSAFVYFGDVRATFQELVLGETFLRRCEEHLASGDAYERGEISVDELAGRWGVDVPDVLAQLEALRIVRPREALRLAGDDRASRLSRLRADRSARGDAPDPRPEHVRRNVIASQRIEGIDARTHFPRTPPRDPS